MAIKIKIERQRKVKKIKDRKTKPKKDKKKSRRETDDRIHSRKASLRQNLCDVTSLAGNFGFQTTDGVACGGFDGWVAKG